MRTLPPIVSATLAPASAVPVIAAVDCSAALIRSSPATFEIVGESGTCVSILMPREPVCEALPAASVACTYSVSSPWPMAAMSAAVNV